MEQTRERKTDRRTLYTRMVIKDALLALLAEKDYVHITVTDICREADIHRSTFYLHYPNIPEVLDALFADALGSTRSLLTQLGCEGGKEGDCAWPLCTFLRENRKYQPLFFSDALRSLVVERIAASGLADFTDRLRERTGLSEEVLQALFYFQLNGCLAVVRQNVALPAERWAHIQCGIDRFLKNGFEHLSEP